MKFSLKQNRLIHFDISSITDVFGGSSDKYKEKKGNPELDKVKKNVLKNLDKLKIKDTADSIKQSTLKAFEVDLKELGIKDAEKIKFYKLMLEVQFSFLTKKLQKENIEKSAEKTAIDEFLTATEGGKDGKYTNYANLPLLNDVINSKKPIGKLRSLVHDLGKKVGMEKGDINKILFDFLKKVPLIGSFLLSSVLGKETLSQMTNIDNLSLMWNKKKNDKENYDKDSTVELAKEVYKNEKDKKSDPAKLALMILKKESDKDYKLSLNPNPTKTNPEKKDKKSTFEQLIVNKDQHELISLYLKEDTKKDNKNEILTALNFKLELTKADKKITNIKISEEKMYLVINKNEEGKKEIKFNNGKYNIGDNEIKKENMKA